MFDSILHPSKLWPSCELWLHPDHPPAGPGVYAWYFDRDPPGVPTGDCLAVDGGRLLYVGISPARPGSKQHLRKRLRQHFHGSARGSTLRTTLGCLLQDELGLEIDRLCAKGRRFTRSSEDSLSDWMARHARIAWQASEEPWIVERELIGRLSLPLNLRGNERHPFYTRLRHERAEMMKRGTGGWVPGSG